MYLANPSGLIFYSELEDYMITIIIKQPLTVLEYAMVMDHCQDHH